MVHAHIRQSLQRAIRVLFPANASANIKVREHWWTDRKYVGERHGRALTWRGSSANLQRADPRLRAVFIDYVDHVYGREEAVALFGPTFADALGHASPAVITFVLDFPVSAEPDIAQAGFVARHLQSKRHACAVMPIAEYLETHPSVHASQIVELLMLQRALANQRSAVRGVEEKVVHGDQRFWSLAGSLIAVALANASSRSVPSRFALVAPLLERQPEHAWIECQRIVSQLLRERLGVDHADEQSLSVLIHASVAATIVDNATGAMLHALATEAPKDPVGARTLMLVLAAIFGMKE